MMAWASATPARRTDQALGLDVAQPSEVVGERGVFGVGGHGGRSIERVAGRSRPVRNQVEQVAA